MRCVATLVLILDMPSSSAEIDKAPVRVVCREGAVRDGFWPQRLRSSLSDPPCFGLRLLLLYLILDTACSTGCRDAEIDSVVRGRERKSCNSTE
jgi:hypothetical protein